MIRVDDKGIARLEGTNRKVMQVVLDRLAHGWSDEEIHRQHPDLPMDAIKAAFAWYADHTEEIDRQIADSLAFAERARYRADWLKILKPSGTEVACVVLRHGQDGYIVAECPQVTGCFSQGRTRAEALANIREAIAVSKEQALPAGFMPAATTPPTDNLVIASFGTLSNEGVEVVLLAPTKEP